MRVKLTKGNLSVEYHLSETLVFKQFATIHQDGPPEVADDIEKFNSQAEAVQWIYDWTMARLKLGWEIV